MRGSYTNICILCRLEYYLRFSSARRSPAPEGFFSHYQQRGDITCDWYIEKHAWISAGLWGGAWLIKRGLAGSIRHGIAFLLPETIRSRATLRDFFFLIILRRMGKNKV